MNDEIDKPVTRQLSAVEQLERKLKARQDAERQARKALDDADQVAILQAKLDHGEHAVSALRLSKPKPGLPSVVVVRKPDKTEYKRFRDLLLREEKKKAFEFIQADCRLYPDDATFAAMRDEFQELPDAIMAVAVALAKGGAVDEGKG